MAHYTTELRKFLDWPDLQAVLKSYPIEDESNRPTLNNLFIARYYFREIGYETPEMFIQRLDFKLREIMPEYNMLYRSVINDIDMLHNVDIVAISNEHAKSTSSGGSESTSTGDTRSSSDSISDQFDMPQTMLDQDGDYLTSRGASKGATAGDTRSESKDAHRDSSDADRDTETKTVGRSGVSASALVLEYREAIVNVNRMVVDDLGVLFHMMYRPSMHNH